MQLESFECVLCQNSEEETVHRLFLNCQFSRDCWNSIGITIQNEAFVPQAIQQIKDQAHPSFFMQTIILLCWSIWTVRNDLIFKGAYPSVARVKEIYKKEMKILSLRAKAKFSQTFDLWIQNLL